MVPFSLRAYQLEENGPWDLPSRFVCIVSATANTDLLNISLRNRHWCVPKSVSTTCWRLVPTLFCTSNPRTHRTHPQQHDTKSALLVTIIHGLFWNWNKARVGAVQWLRRTGCGDYNQPPCTLQHLYQTKLSKLRSHGQNKMLLVVVWYVSFHLLMTTHHHDEWWLCVRAHWLCCSSYWYHVSYSTWFLWTILSLKFWL